MNRNKLKFQIGDFIVLKDNYNVVAQVIWFMGRGGVETRYLVAFPEPDGHYCNVGFTFDILEEEYRHATDAEIILYG